MSAEESSKTKRNRRSKYIFKITVVGPDDHLLGEVLRVLNRHLVSVDGITIGSTHVELEQSDVSTLMMSPGKSAKNLMLSLTFKGSNAAIIVMKTADPGVEAEYRNRIREAIGPGQPTRVFLTGARFTEKKRDELLALLNEIADELVDARESSISKASNT